MQLVVVGGGFAGAILARVARAQGHDVTLVERGVHPRFALGESSTPLAAIALERLATRYGLDDLRVLAAHGRWRERLPEVRRGLKRGFTFYRHETGVPFRNDTDNSSRLLVAASPADAMADAHWYRQDVDHYLVRRAVTEGVTYLDSTSVTGVDEHADDVRLTLDQGGRARELTTDLVVDASGSGGAVACHVGAGDRRLGGGLHTGLVYGHFEGVRPLRTVATGSAFPEGPYPDERAAVHHLLDEGWMYELRFDDEVVSAGFVVEEGVGGLGLQDSAPADVFRALLSRHPTLAAQFAGARPTRPVGAIPRLQRRRLRAAGARWALLPHTYTFWSPLFSTGIAWSLVGVERLGLLLERVAQRGQDRLETSLQRYGRALEVDADHLHSLIEAAYRARRTFDAFDAISQVYFAAASYNEAIQRLCEPPPGVEAWAWSGFLGATDSVMRGIVDRTARIARDGSTDPSTVLGAVARLIAPRNVAGLADRSRRRLYPVDFEALVAASHALGLSPDDARARLPRLSRAS